MTTLKASARFDEPVTPEGLEQAIERGRKRASAGVRATAVQYLPQLGSLLFSFLDHTALSLPVKNYPELAALDESDLQSLSLGFGGSALCLRTRDMHVSIAGLVTASQPLMDMATSLVAARNGKKTALQSQLQRVKMAEKGGVQNWP